MQSLATGGLLPLTSSPETVTWQGKRMAVEVDEAKTDPLVGMALLEGSKLTIDVERGGAVTISRLH